MYTVLLLTLLAQPPKTEPLKLDPFIASAIEPAATDTPLRKLQKERVRQRAEYVARVREVMKVGRYNATEFVEYQKVQAVLAENLAELKDAAADKIKCYEMRVAALEEAERFIATRVSGGASFPQHLNLVKAARIDAEIDLVKLKDSLKGGK